MANPIKIRLADMLDHDLFTPRELSWLSFNEVLAELALKLNTITGHYDSYQASGITGELDFTAAHIAEHEPTTLDQCEDPDEFTRVISEGDGQGVLHATSSIIS